MNKFLDFAENTFACMALTYFSQAFFILIFFNQEGDNPDQSSLLLQLIGFLIYLISFSLIALRWQKTIKALRKNIWILLVIALATISFSWSSVPETSLRQIITLVGSTSFGIYFGSHINWERRISLMAWTFGIAVVCSFLFVALLPHGIMTETELAGAWRGIYMHKNGLGGVMFISFMTFYFLSYKEGKSKFLNKLFCLLSVVLVYFSSSSTSLVSVMMVFMILKTMKYLSLRSKLGVLLIIVYILSILIVSLILIVNLNNFLNLGNKDITLTGRTILWEYLWEFIRSQFWLGYGYGSFFSNLHHETLLLWQVESWKPVNAHNGFIQVWLGLGLIGCFTFSFGYLYSVTKALLRYLILKDFRFLWIFSFFIYTIFFNITEVSFLSGNSLNWVISVSLVYSLDSKLENS